MPNYITILWDLPDDPNGNVQHIARNNVREDEVSELLQDATIARERSRTGRSMARGFTTSGEYLVVIYEEIDPFTARPVTAFKPPQ